MKVLLCDGYRNALLSLFENKGYQFPFLRNIHIPEKESGKDRDRDNKKREKAKVKEKREESNQLKSDVLCKLLR